MYKPLKLKETVRGEHTLEVIIPTTPDGPVYFLTTETSWDGEKTLAGLWLTPKQITELCEFLTTLRGTSNV